MKNLRIIFGALAIGAMFASCNPYVDSRDFENRDFNPGVEDLMKANVPVLKITTEDNKPIVEKTEKINATFELTASFLSETYGADFKDLSLSGTIKGRGNTSWMEPKKPYTISLESKTKILGMGKSKKWVLISNYGDQTLLRNYCASLLSNKVYNSTWNPSFQFVQLILNGEYRGLYILGESIKIEEKRVNIADITEDENGGFIAEINFRMDEMFNFKTKHHVCVSLKDPDEIPAELQAKIKSIVQTAENAMYADNFADSENGYAKYIDVDSFVDWYLINEISKNVDARFFGSCYFYYDNNDQKIHMGPAWDFDRAFGNVDYKGCDKAEGFYIKKSAEWYKRLFEDPAFVKKVQERWTEKRSALDEAVNVDLGNKYLEIFDAAELNFTRWETLGHHLKSTNRKDDFETYMGRVSFLENWLKNRLEFLDENIMKL